MTQGNPVVGWGTTEDGQHVPIHADLAKALFDAADAAKAKREADMPNEQAAIQALNAAVLRLADFGWRDPVYTSKTVPLELLEAGSTGIHKGFYDGEWPTGRWYIVDGDIWPSRPVLARVT